VHASVDIADKLGKERASRICVTRDWLNAGITVALGSDMPTSPWYAPQVTLAQAILRLDAKDKPLNPEQALTIQEALRAHTMGSAYAAFEEKVKGSLEPGKMADLIVWSANIYSITPMEILRTPIETTMIGGKIVFQA
jgi:predicted amidohydrolase YtcJ